MRGKVEMRNRSPRIVVAPLVLPVSEAPTVECRERATDLHAVESVDNEKRQTAASIINLGKGDTQLFHGTKGQDIHYPRALRWELDRPRSVDRTWL